MLFRARGWQKRSRWVLLTSLAAVAWLSAWGCGGEILGGVAEPEPDMAQPGPRRLTHLTVAPDNDVVLVDLNQTTQRKFSVLAHFSDATVVDVSDSASLRLENSDVGALVGLSFQAAQSATTKVGFSKVLASFTENGQTYAAYGNLTVVWLRLTGAATDFFFKLPYKAAPQTQPLQFGTNLQSLDSFFAVDTTGSMGPSIQALRNSLSNSIIPGVKAAAAKDAQFGVAAVEDFAVSPYGVPGSYPGNPDDQSLIMLQNMTADVISAQTAVGKLLNGANPRGNGNDLPEGQMEALYQLATGVGNVVSGVSNIPANRTGIGGAGFRKGALPVITMISDAIFHTKGEPAASCAIRLTSGGTQTISAEYAGAAAAAAHTRAETHAALNKICAKVVGVSALRTVISGAVSDPSGICSATSDLVAAAKATGAVVLPVAWDAGARPAGCASGQCCTGLLGTGEPADASGECPLVFKIAQDGSGLGAQVVSGITQVARYSKFDVTTQKSGNTTGDKGEPLPAGKSAADFITAVTPKDASPPPAPPTLPTPTIDGNSFTKVYPGSTVRFSVTAENTMVESTEVPQIFRATIKVLAGGCADLDQREVIILVPPRAPILG